MKHIAPVILWDLCSVPCMVDFGKDGIALRNGTLSPQYGRATTPHSWYVKVNTMYALRAFFLVFLILLDIWNYITRVRIASNHRGRDGNSIEFGKRLELNSDDGGNFPDSPLFELNVSSLYLHIFKHWVVSNMTNMKTHISFNFFKQIGRLLKNDGRFFLVRGHKVCFC